MSELGCCPYCRLLDVRPVISHGLELAGYRCQDCSRVFFIADILLPTPELPHASDVPLKVALEPIVEGSTAALRADHGHTSADPLARARLL